MTENIMTEIPYDEEIANNPGDDPGIETDGQDPKVTADEGAEKEPEAGTEDRSPSPSQDVGEDPAQKLETTLRERDEELQGYRRLFEDLKADTERRMRMANEETFLTRVRESYRKDPVAAFRMMVERSQHELWEAVQDRLQEELRREAHHRKTLNDVMALPANTFLKAYGDELELLTGEKGFDVNEAADLLRRLDMKARSAVREKAGAVRRVRNGAAVESGGASSRPPDPDREFYRIIRKARTLDDMFEGLRRAGRNGPYK